MTNPRSREYDRAVRAYKREHPGITLAQARATVAARSARQPGLPARIAGAPLPRPAERLEGYVKRVAAAVGVQRHRAMELLGLEPGTSATGRLDELAAGPLPDHTVRALTAATGMTPEQARALTAPLPARPALAAVQCVTEEHFPAGHFRRGGGEGKTSTSTNLTAALSPTFAQRARMIDLESQHTLLPDPPVDALHRTPYTPVFVDLGQPADDVRPPVDPKVVDEAAKTLGIELDADTDTPPRA
ncbi:hypothetical protein [Streptomyces sp. NPDC015350]|uniref:hypothetical protein n=1 Tax=Streptomyces sp. NPDC015350 TaxID=3364955 RepID=UPI0036FCDC79